MKIYWGGTEHIPELAGLSRTDRCNAWRTCYWKFIFRDRKCRMAILIACILAALGSIAGDTSRYVFGLASVIQYACWFIGAEIGFLIHFNIVVGQLRPHLREYLANKQPHG